MPVSLCRGCHACQGDLWGFGSHECIPEVLAAPAIQAGSHHEEVEDEFFFLRDFQCPGSNDATSGAGNHAGIECAQDVSVLLVHHCLERRFRAIHELPPQEDGGLALLSEGRKDLPQDEAEHCHEGDCEDDEQGSDFDHPVFLLLVACVEVLNVVLLCSLEVSGGIPSQELPQQTWVLGHGFSGGVVESHWWTHQGGSTGRNEEQWSFAGGVGGWALGEGGGLGLLVQPKP